MATHRRSKEFGGSQEVEGNIGSKHGQATDASSGKTYYYNKKTKEVMWVKPSALLIGKVSLEVSPMPQLDDDDGNQEHQDEREDFLDEGANISSTAASSPPNPSTLTAGDSAPLRPINIRRT